MAVAFTKLLDPTYREHPSPRPYAGPASAFLKSPPPSALPWPKFIKSSTLKSKSRTTGSPHATPTSPAETGKQSNAISPHSAHEITTTGGETTKNYLGHAQTEDQRAAPDTQQIKPKNNSRGPTPKVDKYGRIQSLGSPLEVWERRAAQKDTAGRRSPILTCELANKHTARRADHDWRTPVVEDQTATQAKRTSDDDDRTIVNAGSKSLADEDEAQPDVDSRALIKHDKFILPATARVAVDIEIRVDRIGGRDEGAMGFMFRFVIGLLLALEGLESL